MTERDQYIKTAYTGSEHFTAGKYYPVWSKYGMTCRVIDDDGIGRLVIAPGGGACPYLDGKGEWKYVGVTR